MRYNGPVHINHYGKPVPKEAHGSVNLERFTSSGRIITEAMMGLFDRCVDPNLLVRRITVAANHIISENDIPADKDADQPDLFTDYEALEKQRAAEQAELDKEKRLQQAIIGSSRRLLLTGAAVLSHHRTYGSVYGGFRLNCLVQLQIG